MLVAPLPPSLVFAVAGALLPPLFANRPRARLATTMVGSVATFCESLLGNGLVAGALVFATAAAGLRFAEALPYRPRTPPTHEPLMGFGHYLDCRTLPTLETLWWRHEHFRQLLSGLTDTIRGDAELQEFFQLPDTRDPLVEQIGRIQVADYAIGNVTTAVGIFSPFEHVVFGARDSEIMAHELTHVLHYARIRDTLTYGDLARVVATIDTEALHPGFRPYYDSVAAYVRDHPSEHAIPSAIRDVGALLILFIGNSTQAAHLEALATHVQTQLPRALRTWKGRRTLWFNQGLARFLGPLAWAGGALHDTECVRKTIGYGSRHFLRRAVALGPVGSCLGAPAACPSSFSADSL